MNLLHVKFTNKLFFKGGDIDVENNCSACTACGMCCCICCNHPRYGNFQGAGTFNLFYLYVFFHYRRDGFFGHISQKVQGDMFEGILTEKNKQLYRDILQKKEEKYSFSRRYRNKFILGSLILLAFIFGAVNIPILFLSFLLLFIIVGIYVYYKNYNKIFITTLTRCGSPVLVVTYKCEPKIFYIDPRYVDFFIDGLVLKLQETFTLDDIGNFEGARLFCSKYFFGPLIIAIIKKYEAMQENLNIRIDQDDAIGYIPDTEVMNTENVKSNIPLNNKSGYTFNKQNKQINQELTGMNDIKMPQQSMQNNNQNQYNFTNENNGQETTQKKYNNTQQQFKNNSQSTTQKYNFQNNQDNQDNQDK